MNRTQRAIAHANMDAVARSIGVRDAAEYEALLRIHRKLDTGGRVTEADIEAAHRRGSITVQEGNQISDYVMSAPTARDRADRYAVMVAQIIGAPDVNAVRELARRQSTGLEVQEFAGSITGKLNERDRHRDQQNGIDQRERVEAAKRSAAQNPDAQRRHDLAREIARHEGPRSPLYSGDRREVLAQASDRIGERMRAQQVRDADPNRRPDRGDDRRDDIALEFDRLTVQDAAHDELAIAGNPLLENIDNRITSTLSRDE